MFSAPSTGIHHSDRYLYQPVINRGSLNVDKDRDTVNIASIHGEPGIWFSKANSKS